MHTDYSERRNSDFEHIVRGAEHSKKHLWYELKAGKANVDLNTPTTPDDGSDGGSNPSGGTPAGGNTEQSGGTSQGTDSNPSGDNKGDTGQDGDGDYELK